MHNIVESADEVPSTSATAPLASREGQARPRVLRIRLAGSLVPLVALLLLWLGAFDASGAFKGGPNGKTFGGDFAILLSASRVLEAGSNPYDHSLLYHTEYAFLHRQSVPAPTSQPFIRVGNPPLLFWALQPLTGLPFQRVALAWVLSMCALVAMGFLAALRSFGWRTRLIPALLFLAMPQTVLSAYYGNVDGLVFASVGCALALCASRGSRPEGPRLGSHFDAVRPFMAGALLSFAWLKPQVTLPAVLLIALFHTQSRSRLLAGFGCASAALVLLTGVTAGWHSLSLWVGALTGYSRYTAIQPDLASLTGLYVYWASPQLHVILQAATLGLACALTLIWWWKVRSRPQVPFLAVAWLWVVWFLAAPFAHFHDEILLAIPLLALLGRDGRNSTQEVPGFLPTCALYIMFLSAFLFPTARFHTDLQSLSLLPVAAIALLMGQRQLRESWS